MDQITAVPRNPVIVAHNMNSMVDTKRYRSWHLARTEHEALTTEFEWSLLRFQEAFQRFCLQVASISGLGSLNYSELIILHVINMQSHPQPSALIARQLNRDDLPNIQYSLRKLIKQGLVEKVKDTGGKTYCFDATDKGRELLQHYARLRHELLTEQTKNIEQIDRKLFETGRLISLLTGLYDEAGRISATYSPYMAEDEDGEPDSDA
ncbi:winged helix DNA-binding protein [Alkalilimnicola ehrlichii MLHE-1]|uniref:Putative transcriptional regulator n=1 Tax=Alkalilimnicola ehrlichii (strain ATCC BAA-1101 / DSM 17681 / MLHE-1) TaxID=187272 RepID=Q0A5S7_ALKEH|nr:winged helix DNA-binding protein [Alkalilimnicola ehrlichii]ABI57810.1 putative transcriptional regulator [Alkalilimnicola ehrlichii MLHE-1]